MNMNLKNKKTSSVIIIVLILLNIVLSIKYIKSTISNNKQDNSSETLTKIESISVQKYDENEVKRIEKGELKILIIMKNNDCQTCIRKIFDIYEKYYLQTRVKIYLLVSDIKDKESLINYYLYFNKNPNIYILNEIKLNPDYTLQTPSILVVDPNNNIVCQRNIKPFNRDDDLLFLARLTFILEMSREKLK